MVAPMPERIWAWGNNKIAWWHDKPEYGATEYVRADLAVLATTHQRTLEALERFMAIARAERWSDGSNPAKDAAAYHGAVALARIKEAT